MAASPIIATIQKGAKPTTSTLQKASTVRVKNPLSSGSAVGNVNSGVKAVAKAGGNLVGQPNANLNPAAKAVAKAGGNLVNRKVATSRTNGTTGNPAGGTNWLDPMTGQQVAKEAAGIVSKEYKPELTDIDSQVDQANNLDAKRAYDQKVYDNWLATTGAALQTNSAAVMQHLDATNQAIAATTGANIDATNAAPLPTGGGQVDPQSLQGEYQTGVATADKGLTGLAAELSNKEAAIGYGGIGEAEMNAIADQSNLRQSQISALQTTLQNLNTDRTKAYQSQIADTAKEVAALQNEQIQVAQYNQNNAETNAKLKEALAAAGISQQGETARTIAEQSAESQRAAASNAASLQRTKITTAAESKRAAAALAASLSEHEQTLMQQDKQYKLDVRKEGAAEAVQQYEEQHHLGVFKTGTYSGTHGNAISQTDTNSAFDTIENARSTYNYLKANAWVMDPTTNTLVKANPNQVFALLAQGGTYYLPEPHKTSTGTGYTAPAAHTVSQVNDKTLLNAGVTLARTGKIGEHEVTALNARGIYGVRKRYQVG